MQVYRQVSGVDGLECTRDGLFRYKGRPKKVIYSHIINGRKATAKITIQYKGKSHYWQAAKLVAKTWKVGYEEFRKKEREQRSKWIRKQEEMMGTLRVVELPREEVISLIMQDLTIPQIHEKLPQFTYDQIYDTFSVDTEFNKLYRKHGQLKVKKVNKK